MSDKIRLHLANWQRLRRGEGTPRLIDLFTLSDPVTQPWLVVIDTERDDVQSIRLAGTGVVDFFGFDATGYDFLQTVTPDLRQIFLDAHRALATDMVGKFHLSVCSTSSGREVEVFAFALPYLRNDGRPCAVWLLDPGARLHYGETGSEVRAVTFERWVDLSAAVGP